MSQSEYIKSAINMGLRSLCIHDYELVYSDQTRDYYLCIKCAKVLIIDNCKPTL
jgi:hypothetical protein